MSLRSPTIPKIWIEYEDKKGIHGLVKAKELNDNSFLIKDGSLEYIIEKNDFYDIDNLTTWIK